MPPRERIWAIDWLRMYDVFIVIMGHCIRFLDDKESDVKLAGHGSNSYLNVIMLFGNMCKFSLCLCSQLFLFYSTYFGAFVVFHCFSLTLLCFYTPFVFIIGIFAERRFTLTLISFLPSLQFFISSLLSGVMPLFFFLAGAAANLSITSKTNALTYLVKRVLRIGIPLFGGFFLAVLPYAFIARDYLDCDENLISDENMSDNPWKFYQYYFTNCFAKHGFKWLWFLAMLAFMTGLHLPIIFSLKRSVLATDEAVKNKLYKQTMLVGVVYMLGWTLFW